MNLQTLRASFLKFFQEQGHTILPSSPVIPHGDDSLLFANAGMNQFKDFFLGAQASHPKVTTVQKCIRAGGKHNDLSHVGHTSRHLTFFEMYGNFSFGSYFKQEAIAFAWKVSLEVFKLDPEKIWATIFYDDEASFELWRCYLPEERIVRKGEADNFWSMGETGPCGPCSELLYDRGAAYGDEPSPATDEGERFLEFWNLVFMEFNRSLTSPTTALPRPCIDTGGGLERMAMLTQGFSSLFQLDVFQRIISSLSHMTTHPYQASTAQAPYFHVIADHLRALCFAIADGALPSNTERGYILRKLLRRAVRHGKELGIQKPFLARLVPTLLEMMGSDYPELLQAQATIEQVLTTEEEHFMHVLKKGGHLLHTLLAANRPIISGEEAFKLKDTYGFPLEEIILVAHDAGKKVDLERFNILEQEAKKISSQKKKEADTTQDSLDLTQLPTTDFVGYDLLSTQACIVGLSTQGKLVSCLEEGAQGSLILDRSSFYAEKGGQKADIGDILGNNQHFRVDSVVEQGRVWIHTGRVIQGRFQVKDKVSCHVDSHYRQAICQHHTATHLLHFALAHVLGSHVQQAGSLVESQKLRFDFLHHTAVTEKELKAIEQLVNEKIQGNQAVTIYELPLEQAMQSSDIKHFFGDKYGSCVRVVDINYSKELCGGTHATSTGALGLFKIVYEKSIASGVRRIEAVVGQAAVEYVWHLEELITQIQLSLKTTKEAVVTKVTSLVEEHKALQKKVEKAQASFVGQLASQLLKTIQVEQGIPYLIAQVDIDPALVAQAIMEQSSSLALCLLYQEGAHIKIVSRVSQDLTSKNIDAKSWVAQIMEGTGKGGGSNRVAQAVCVGAMHELLAKAKLVVFNMLR